MKKAFGIIFTLLILTNSVAAQTRELDSLNQLVKSVESDSMKGYVLDELSYVWFYRNLDSSLLYAKKSLDVFASISLKKGISRAYTSIAVAYHYKHNWDSAEVYYRKAMLSNQQLEDQKGVAGSLNNLGVLFMDKGDLEQAASQFLTSLSIKESLGDSVGMSSGNANLGLIFRKQGNYERAITYYSKSLELLHQLGIKRQLPTIYLNMGSLYNYKNDFETGLKYNQMGLKISKKLNSIRYIGESYVNLSDSYLGLTENDSSLYYINLGIDIFRSNSDSVNLSKALNSASSLFLQKKDYKSALVYSNEVKLLNNGKNLDLEVKNTYNLAKAYEGLHQMTKAYQWLQKSYSRKDSLLNESLNKTIVDLTTQYESEKKGRKILSLEKEKIEAELNAAQSQSQRNVSLLVAISILGVSMLLYSLYRVKSKSEATISKSLAEKETLLKEIHHRVKNNLQVVSSLLSMQSRFIKDEQALGAVNEGQTRVQSMALIHQKLYQENQLSGVKTQDYVEDLADVLKTTYRTDIDVEFNYDIDQLTIDVDTIIPIGLILNELICNALKHAFTDEEEPLINIKLKEGNEALVLEVRDNGKGTEGHPSNQSFGMVLIESLATKLKAKFDIRSDNGTVAILHITKYKLV